MPLLWKYGILTTELLGKSFIYLFFSFSEYFFHIEVLIVDLGVY